LGAAALAIDGCEEMLRHARGARVLGDASGLPLRDASIDVVICSLMLGYAPGAFEELARVAKPGGAVFVTDLHPEALARGWGRAFRVGDEVIRPAHHGYRIDELHDDSLLLRQLWEPAFDEPERAIFEQAGKGAQFQQTASHPAIFVACWSKVC
jgi:ubiquinone/menaquinone biosynthesis C-methylase UbiE